VTHVGTATLLLDFGSVRILTDPALDPAGRRYGLGFGTSSVKTADPVLPRGGLGTVAAALVSHDQHADNLDASGRQALRTDPLVLTTPAGARRLGSGARGLRAWESADVPGPDGAVRVTAVPARHGPAWLLPAVGPATGFILEPARGDGAVYVSGDTVWFAGLEEIGRRFAVQVAILHVGAVAFPITGPVRYTMNGADAARLAKALDAAVIIPVHYDGWRHFREPKAGVQGAFERAGLGGRVRWLAPGIPAAVEC
jgi:L-ascorbate metabolism protein UlaG (beta-lactamase superfamily)